mgnify:FL=1
MHTNKNAKGFTLIELMIVVAIIGILAAIAIPQYNKYVARTQVAEAFALLGPVKQALTLYHQETGNFPAWTNAADVHETLGIPEQNVHRGSNNYIRLMQVGAGGKITVSFKNNKDWGVSKLIEIKSFEMMPSISSSGVITGWTCAPGGGRPIDEIYIKSCM